MGTVAFWCRAENLSPKSLAVSQSLADFVRLRRTAWSLVWLQTDSRVWWAEPIIHFVASKFAAVFDQRGVQLHACFPHRRIVSDRGDDGIIVNDSASVTAAYKRRRLFGTKRVDYYAVRVIGTPCQPAPLARLPTSDGFADRSAVL